MTMALCFSCGDVKFGAICPCSKCGVNSTGDMGLDILFSDHNMAVSTLEQFGLVVKLINSNVENPPIRFWAFMQYVSVNHSDLLSIGLPGDIADQVTSLYERLEFPPVEMRSGRQEPKLADRSEKPPGEGRPKKKWWKFGRE